MQNRHKTLRMRDGIDIESKIHEIGSEVWIIATHGIGEHMERHNYLNELFGSDFNIFQYDLRGHGKSQGKRAWVENFGQFMEDLDEIIQFLKSQYKMKRYVLFGHSMGALITSAYLQNYANKSFYPERVIINAPPVGYHGILGDVIRVTPTPFINQLATLGVSTPLAGLVDLNYLSHDAHVKEQYIRDELNCLKLHTKLLLNMVMTSKKVFSRPLRPECPLFVSYGTEDKIIGTSDLRDYFHFVEKAVTVTELAGAYHEIHNEIEKYKKPYFDYLKRVFNNVIYPD